MLRHIITCLAVAVLSISPSYAVDANIEEYKKELIALNQDIGTYYFAQDHLAKELQDQSHHVVGSVQDFLINNQGEVQALIGELNDMGLGTSQLHLAYNDLSQTQDAYTLALKGEELEEELAVFLANIETAAGADEEPLVSVRRLHGRNVILPSGEPIGEVEQVLTDKESQKIVGVLIKGLDTRPDYERFALPYPNGLKIKNTGFSNNLQLSEDFVEVIEQFTAEGIPN